MNKKLENKIEFVRVFTAIMWFVSMIFLLGIGTDIDFERDTDAWAYIAYIISILIFGISAEYLKLLRKRQRFNDREMERRRRTTHYVEKAYAEIEKEKEQNENESV